MIVVRWDGKHLEKEALDQGGYLLLSSTSEVDQRREIHQKVTGHDQVRVFLDG